MVRAAGLCALLCACNAEVPVVSTGGTDRLAGACGRGLAVVLTDYQSTNVALVDTAGHTLTGSLLSSGSANPGLSAALSGDVVLAGEPVLDDQLLVIDRHNSVVSLVDVKSAEVAQLDVSSGFWANPHDAARVGGQLWISRFNHNTTPKNPPADRGGDLVAVDLASRAPTGVLSLVVPDPGALANPGRIVRIGTRLVVLVDAYDSSFVGEAPSELMVVDTATKAVTSHVLAGLFGCNAMALEPSTDEAGMPRTKQRLVVGCWGPFHGKPYPDIAQSGLAVLTLDGSELHEVSRFPAKELAGKAVGFDLDVDAGGRALVTAMGDRSSGVPDSLVELELDSGKRREVLQVGATNLGGVRCISRVYAKDPNAGKGSACSNACFIADAERGVLHRLIRGAAGYQDVESIKVETAIGLPPRLLGRF